MDKIIIYLKILEIILILFNLTLNPRINNFY